MQATDFNQTSVLQQYNSELSSYMENIKTQREELHEEIVEDETEKLQIETEILSLQERLSCLTDNLHKKYEARDEFDGTISETEQAFMKILESSQTLLHILKKEDTSLSKKKNLVQSKKPLQQQHQSSVYNSEPAQKLETPEKMGKEGKRQSSSSAYKRQTRNHLGKVKENSLLTQDSTSAAVQMQELAL